jgi:hypothetical protein
VLAGRGMVAQGWRRRSHERAGNSGMCPQCQTCTLFPGRLQLAPAAPALAVSTPWRGPTAATGPSWQSAACSVLRGAAGSAALRIQLRSTRIASTAVLFFRYLMSAPRSRWPAVAPSSPSRQRRLTGSLLPPNYWPTPAQSGGTGGSGPELYKPSRAPLPWESPQ